MSNIKKQYEEWYQEAADMQLWPPVYHICHHEWIEYVGLTERYTFCEKCDERKSDDV